MSTGSIVSSGIAGATQNGVYYLNNRETGKYLYKTASSTAGGQSGLIADLGSSIRWQITHVANDKYTIQSTEDPTLFLKAEDGASAPTLSALPASSEVSDNYLWKILTASGGGTRIRNVATEQYLRSDGTTNSLTATLPSSSTNDYDYFVWRVANANTYGNTSAHSKREIDEHFTLKTTTYLYRQTTPIEIVKSPTNALWSSADDFIYEDLSENYSLVQSSICGDKYGSCQIRATHKVTGVSKTLDIFVRHDNEYTNKLVSIFGFQDDAAVLITRLYPALQALYSNDSTMELAWRFSRLLGGFVYNGEYTYSSASFSEIMWDSVAGVSIDIYEGDSIVSEQVYFTKYLGYTVEEYDLLNQAVCKQYRDSSKDNDVADFAHMQIALSARFAYSLEKGNFLPDIVFGSDLMTSFAAGWLGDATLDLDDGYLSLNNDDYMADLDAENIYCSFIDDQDEDIIQITIDYYDSLTVSNNRAVMFKQNIPYDFVENSVFLRLFGSNFDEDDCWAIMEINDYYTPPYNFLLSLLNNCAELQSWKG